MIWGKKKRQELVNKYITGTSPLSEKERKEAERIIASSPALRAAMEADKMLREGVDEPFQGLDNDLIIKFVVDEATEEERQIVQEDMDNSASDTRYEVEALREAFRGGVLNYGKVKGSYANRPV